MIEFVYSSSSVGHFTGDQLLELLAKSRRNNKSLDITGMLLFKDGDFLQVLEGDEDRVRALSKKIAGDPRHTNFKILLVRSCTKREFPDWSMGFQNLDELNPQDVPGYTTFLDSPLRSLPFTTDPTLCRRFLMMFKNRTKTAV